MALAEKFQLMITKSVDLARLKTLVHQFENPLPVSGHHNNKKTRLNDSASE